ncbi:class I tRNA ligase family protein [Paraburkholderia tuberum]|uniref:class I tRNA ligase family protein n=1 Tax=Paraburkholderia tuberum TaxID=157910 RepID=UPI000A92BD95|nr:class I tRNA ligase family protein [Paraburkholderia tuberum]
MTTRTFFVCPAPPCPNGKLHLGHIGGVYLLTDLFVRFQRMRGHRAYHVTGADEHGTYTVVKARKLGRPIDEVAQLHIDEIMDCLRAMHIEPDVFIGTTDATHKQNSLKIFRELEAAGYIDVRDGPAKTSTAPPSTANKSTSAFQHGTTSLISLRIRPLYRQTPPSRVSRNQSISVRSVRSARHRSAADINIKTYPM